MTGKVGIWIDHQRAVIVSMAEGAMRVRVVKSAVGPHPHYGGGQVQAAKRNTKRSINIVSIVSMTMSSLSCQRQIAC